MNISKITIQNFRNFGEGISFQFDSRFTVVIGINGKGKSSILHAVRVACGAYFLAIPDVKKRHIRSNEIRLKQFNRLLVDQRPVKIEATGFFPEINKPVIWKRQIEERSNSTTSSEAEVGVIRKLGKEKYEQITKNGNDKVNLPVIAFFGTSRAHGAGRNNQSRIGRQIFKEGYQDWIEMKSSTYKYENWLSSYEILKDNGKEYPNTKKAFLRALKKANPYIEQIETVSSVIGALWLKVKVDDCESAFLPVEYHSDGIRFFTEMVAELAYRCIILNGYLDEKAVEESPGVVMIDEIDLNLHPQWQRQVVQDLKNAFPNIQFIVTTHSPFIVQSLESSELINLDKVTDVRPKDLDIDEVAENVMGVSSDRSEENEKDENLSAAYLKALSTENKNAITPQELNSIEAKISDPAARALLQMKRLQREIETT